MFRERDLQAPAAAALFRDLAGIPSDSELLEAMINRENNSKRATVAADTGYADCSFMGLHSPLRNRKSQTKTSGFARAALIHSVEAVEDARRMLGSDSRAGIPYGDRN